MNGTMKKGTLAFQSPVSRRVFLRGAGGVLSLPLFNDLIATEARAQGMTAPYPKRLIVLFSPNGTVPENYFGPGGTTFTLGSIMTPLTAHKNDLIVLDGIDMKAAGASTGDAHGVGMGCMLTGKKLQTGSQFVAGMGGPGSGWPDNISIDQLIAKTVGAKTPLPSIELAGKRFAGNLWSRMSYSGPAAPVSPQEDPQRAFDAVFGNVITGGGGMDAAARLGKRRKSVLDNALGELTTLSAKLGADDRKKLDEHATRLRDLETRISNMQAGMSADCKPPTRPTVMASPEVIANSSGMEQINAANDKTFPDIIKAQIATIVGAFTCDITRVASLIMSPSRSDVVLSWVSYMGSGFTESHHEVSHYGDTEKDSKNKLTIMNQWYAQQIADLITALKAIPEGSGTLFDNTVILWTNELGVGNSHSHTRIPLMIAGSAQGYFKTGHYIKFPGGTSMNNLLVSVANAMGVMPTATDSSGKVLNNIFGDPAFCTGPLSGLTG